MKAAIDDFQEVLANYFRQQVMGVSYLAIGAQVVAQTSPAASIELLLDTDLKTEPLFLRELLPHRESVRQGIFELFQNKMIAAWSDLLGDLFAKHVEAHFKGGRAFAELKKRRVELDFGSGEPLEQQIITRLNAD